MSPRLTSNLPALESALAPLVRLTAGLLLKVALVGGPCAAATGCHNEFVGYSKSTANSTVDFVLVQENLYVLHAHTLEKSWTPLGSHGSGHKGVDRVDYLVVARNSLGPRAIEIHASKRPEARSGYPGKTLLLLPGRPGDAEPVVVQSRSDFEDELCDDPDALRHYVFSPRRSHWLAVCGSELVLFERGARRQIVEDLERTIPSLRISRYGLGHQALFLSEDARRAVVTSVYEITDGPLEFIELRIGAVTELEPVLIPIPGKAQVMDVAVTESEILVMVEFLGGLQDPGRPGNSLRQAIVSSNGGLYPIRLRAEGIDEDKIGRYSWDPNRNAIVVHRRVPGDRGERLLVYSYDYVRRVEKLAWLPLSEILDDRIGEE